MRYPNTCAEVIPYLDVGDICCATVVRGYSKSGGKGGFLDPMAQLDSDNLLFIVRVSEKRYMVAYRLLTEGDLVDVEITNLREKKGKRFLNAKLTPECIDEILG